jgi:hypothetical protein
MIGEEFLTPCGCDDAADGMDVGEPVGDPVGCLNSSCIEECRICGATWAYVEWSTWVDAEVNS